MMWTRASASLALLLAVAASPARAQVCGESDVEEGLQYLRRLSLDLRGRLPDVAELESVVTNGGQLDPSIVSAMVRSEDAVRALRAHHLKLLWANVTDLRLANQEWQLATNRRDGSGQLYFLTSQGRMRRYRGDQVGCLDEPARFGPAGEILTTPDPMDANVQREGYVMVRPYWNPSVEIKVCAFDAQTALQAPNARGRMVDCVADPSAVGCGCGPELRWCQSQPDRTAAIVTASMGEQMLRFIDRIVREGRPYTEVISAKDVEVNGPLSHYLRFQTQGILNQIYGNSDVDFTVPEIAFSEVDRWESVMREDTHAGVLTMPGYLLKFQSNRGRANRFYNAFMCQSFLAPAGGLPAADDECNREPDLTKRCGCASCHLTVEPLAAYWGRWSEAGFAPMSEAAFPKVREECATEAGARTAACRRFYLTEPGHPDEEPFKGHLLSYVFATPQREANTAIGPKGLAQAAIDNGVFASCATRQLYERLVAREVQEKDQEALDGLTQAFVASNYDVRTLVEGIVKRPEYVEAGRYTGGAQ